MYVLTKEIDNYLSSCRIQRGLDPKTLKAYRIDLKQYAAFVNMAEQPFSRLLAPGAHSQFWSEKNSQFKPER